VDERCIPGIDAVPVNADAQPANATIATEVFIFVTVAGLVVGFYRREEIAVLLDACALGVPLYDPCEKFIWDRNGSTGQVPLLEHITFMLSSQNSI